MASGLIVGLAFGMGALGAVVLGKIADLSSLGTLMGLCSVLPLFGALAVWLPKDRTQPMHIFLSISFRYNGR
ncbi:hypothetical protein DI43_07545 [Geobacillus sp. CAMR12739]|nr:hypothetical protein DI43_07545 [Geobacillus sp. CAMR12739]